MASSEVPQYVAFSLSFLELRATTRLKTNMPVCNLDICVSSIVMRSSFVLVHRDRPGSPFKHKEIGNVCRCEITIVFFCKRWKKLQAEEPTTHGQIPEATLIDLVTMRFKQYLLDVFVFSNPSQLNSSVHFHSCIVPEPS